MNLTPSVSHRPLPVLLAMSFLLGGCASFSPDGGFGSVQSTVRERAGADLAWIRSDREREEVQRRVEELLSRPLSADDAVQVALLSNRGLQASFEELRIAESGMVEAGELPNPRLSLMRASHAGTAGGREYKLEQSLTMNIFALITRPLASEVEQRNFARAQQAVAAEVLRLAYDTRKAYYAAIAAEETARYQRDVRDIAEAAAELARRMAGVGNFSRLAQAREQGFYAEAALGLARAEQARVAARERLVRLLGLWGEQAQLRLPDRLPALPASAQDLPEVEQRAMRERLDLRAMREEAQALARNLGLTQATRFINVLEFGPARVLEGERSGRWKNGYEVSFELPLFNWGTARVARAEATYMQAVNRAAQLAVEARSEVRESYQAYRTGWDLARHYRDEVVPVRKRIADENLLRYNGMLIGVFELLADARAQVAAVNGAIEALRDFWLAEADLQQAMTGRPTPATFARASTAAPAEAGAGH